MHAMGFVSAYHRQMTSFFLVFLRTKGFLLRLFILGAISVALSFVTLKVFAQGQSPLPIKPGTVQYQVSAGDHLAGILRELGFTNLWGRGGDVQRVRALNRLYIGENGELNPGQWIYLPITNQTKKPSPGFLTTAGVIIRQSQRIEILCGSDASVTVDGIWIPSSQRNKVAKLSIPSPPSSLCSNSRANETGQVVETRLPASDFITPESLAPESLAPEPTASEPQAASVDDQAGPLPHQDPSTEPEVIVPKTWKILFGPKLGYTNQRLEYTPDYFTVHSGALLGAFMGTEWGTSKLGIGARLGYDVAPLINAGVTTDKANYVSLTYSVDIKVYFLRARFLYLDNRLSSANSDGVSFKLKDSGYGIGLAYLRPFYKKWSYGFELLNSRMEYRSSKNSDLVNGLSNTNWQGNAFLEYRWSLK